MIWHFCQPQPREPSGPNINSYGSKKAHILIFFKYISQETFKSSKFSMYLSISHGFDSRENGGEINI